MKPCPGCPFRTESPLMYDAGAREALDGGSEPCYRGATPTRKQHDMKFEVTVERTERRSNVFEVEAASWKEAEDKAMEAACDHDFSTNTVGSADEMVTAVHTPETKP